MARLGQLPMQEPQRAQSSVSMANGMDDLPGQAFEKRPFAVLRASFVTAAYKKVRLIPHDSARLASEHF
jgi:hypothetical protein